MADLRDAGCDILTMGQYLQPTPMHLPVDRWVHPDEFAEHARRGEALGIPHVEAGPLVRSSYHAGTQFRRAWTAHAAPATDQRRRVPPRGAWVARRRAEGGGAGL